MFPRHQSVRHIVFYTSIKANLGIEMDFPLKQIPQFNDLVPENDPYVFPR